ncbi:MAG: hypothetical protein R3C12_11400 [Planctomycetaceae bacterium]
MLPIESAPFMNSADQTPPETNWNLTPREIVAALDRHIVGQDSAKRSVAIALRNRYRWRQLDEATRREITPKNIIMIGPTGVGKTEITRRLATLTGARSSRWRQPNTRKWAITAATWKAWSAIWWRRPSL